jgi:predicted ferric reductase
MSGAALTAALWAFGRGTGVVALVLFTVSIVLGIVARSGRRVPWLGRFGTSDLHRTAALTGAGLVAAHIGSLLFDPYAQLKLVDFVFPFLASYRPLWLGLGTVALDLIGVVTVVSLLRHRVGPRVFKGVHWATYALWPFALLHSLGSGTDAATLWFRALAVVCVSAVVTAVGWRLAPSFEGRGWIRHPRRTAA